MLSNSNPPSGASSLRFRAFARLTGQHAPAAASDSASSALRVLHDLASSPASAADALALLHELQVYQVELELQDENLRNSVAELEAALARQTQVYDAAPVALVTIDESAVIQQLNLQAAAMFGTARDSLPGQSLASLITPEDGSALLHGLIGRVQAGEARVSGNFRPNGTSATSLQVRLGREPESPHFLVALIER